MLPLQINHTLLLILALLLELEDFDSCSFEVARHCTPLGVDSRFVLLGRLRKACLVRRKVLCDSTVGVCLAIKIRSHRFILVGIGGLGANCRVAATR